MILVTVGTNSFDELIKKIDEFVKNGKIKDKVIAQIYDGEYTPKNLEFFRFVPTLEPYYNKADVIIACEGAGTTFEVLSKHKKLITVSNPKTAENPDIVKYFSSGNYLLWCRDLNDLPKYIQKIKKIKLKKYNPPKCRIQDVIREFIQKNS